MNAVITMKRSCYGRFNSFRPVKVGMEEITVLLEAVVGNIKQKGQSHENKQIIL